jgi:hypothetical protein
MYISVWMVYQREFVVGPFTVASSAVDEVLKSS